VKRRPALDVKEHASAYNADTADQQVRWIIANRALDRHVVVDLADPIGMKKARHKDVGVRPVELLVSQIVIRRSDAKPSALGVVQDRSKHTGRIKAWQTKPVDGAIHANQGSGAQVSDHAVVFDWLVAHGVPLPRDRSQH